MSCCTYATGVSLKESTSKGEYVKLQKIYRLIRPASLTRARAKLQNEYQVFLASDESQKTSGNTVGRRKGKGG